MSKATHPYLHPSFGVVPQSKFMEAAQAPAGEAAVIFRQYDPLWGLLKHGQKTKMFKVEVKKRVYRTDNAIVEVEAVNKEQAEKITGHMEWDNFNWDEGYDEDEDDHEVISVKEKQS